MFDLSSAIVLGLVLVGLVSMAKTMVDGPNKSRIIVVICLAVATVAVQLVAASDFAGEQVVLDRALNSMNFASQMVVALLVAGLASGIWEGYTTIKNIGQNQE